MMGKYHSEPDLYPIPPNNMRRLPAKGAFRVALQQPFPATPQVITRFPGEGRRQGLDLKGGGELSDVMKKRKCAKACNLFLGKLAPYGPLSPASEHRYFKNRAKRRGHIGAMMYQVMRSTRNRIYFSPRLHSERRPISTKFLNQIVCMLRERVG